MSMSLTVLVDTSLADWSRKGGGRLAPIGSARSPRHAFLAADGGERSPCQRPDILPRDSQGGAGACGKRAAELRRGATGNNEKGRRSRDALSSRSHGNSGVHPNPVRIRMPPLRLLNEPVAVSVFNRWISRARRPGRGCRHWRIATSVTARRSRPALSCPNFRLRFRQTLIPRAGLQLACCTRRCQFPVCEPPFGCSNRVEPLRSVRHAENLPLFSFISMLLSEASDQRAFRSARPTCR